MNSTSRLDLFIPVCRKDHAQAQLLIRSLDTYLDQRLVGTINICAVDTPEYDSEVTALSSERFSDRLKFWTLSELGLEAADGSRYRGWRLQQASKLAFARFTQTRFYLVLDSKNIALRNVGIEDIFDGPRAACSLEPTAAHMNWWRGSAWALRHFSLCERRRKLALSSGTPVVLHKETVLALHDYLHNKRKTSVEGVLFRQRKGRLKHLFQPTEFTLYYTFATATKAIEDLHFASSDLHDTDSTIWGSHSDTDRTERIHSLIRGRTTGLFAGIARPAWEGLSDIQKSALWKRFSSTHSY